MGPVGWSSFFDGLRANDGDSPPTCYVYEKTGDEFYKGDVIGEGQYGKVYVYEGVKVSTAVPASFCLKFVDDDPSDECALEALEALECLRGVSVQGIVSAKRIGPAQIAMPVYTGTLLDIVRPSPEFYKWAVQAIATTVQTLWNSGLAYCDLKASNVLYRRTKRSVAVVLGDIGSISPIGTRGIFTYPPKRAIRDSEPSDDGIVEPREGDLVWGLGVLLLGLSFGQSFISRASVFTLVEKGKNFDEVADAFRAAASSLDSGCSRAVILAVDAWEGREVSIAHFKDALGLSEPKKAIIAPQL